MNIGQLVYASTPESGWKKTYSSGRVTNEAESFFYGIASNSPESNEVYAMDAKDGIYILSRTFKGESDVFDRETRLTHGYVFYESDREELFTGYKKFLNIDDFLKSHEDVPKEKESLPSEEFDGREYFVGMKGEPHKIIGCIFEAIVKKKTLEIVLPNVEFNTVRAVLSVIYEYMPFSARKLITFSMGNKSSRYLISFVSEKSGGLYYSLIDGSNSITDKEYVYFCDEYKNKGKKFIDEIEKLIKESEKRISNPDDAVKDAFEKKMLKSGTTAIDGENLFVMFVELTSKNKFKDPVYAQKLCELLDRFSESDINISESFSTLTNVYANAEGNKLKAHIVEFVAKTLVKFPGADFKKAMKTISVSSGLRKDFIKLAATGEGYSSLLVKYLNMFFLESDFYDNFACAADEKLSIYKEAEKLLALYADASGIRIYEILKSLYEKDKERYKGMENALTKTEKHAILIKFYSEYLLEVASTTDELKADVRRLEVLGVPINDFVKNSVKKFIIMGISEFKENEIIVNEAKKYASKGGFDCKEYIADIVEARNREFWEKFNFVNFDFNEDYSDKYLKDNHKSNVAERLWNIGKYISEKKKGIYDADKDYVEFFSSGEYIPTTEEAVSVLQKLMDVSADYDVYLLYTYLSGKKQLGKMTIDDADAFGKYLKACVLNPSAHMLKYDNIRENVYKIVLSESSKDNKYKKMLPLFDEYETKLNEAFAKSNPLLAMFGEDTLKLGFISAIISSCLMLIMVRSVTQSSGANGIVWVLITCINFWLCFKESIAEAKKSGKFLKKLGGNFLILAISEILAVVAAMLIF